MTHYLVEFQRIGRTHTVPPSTLTVVGEADLCRQIRAIARPFLRSRDFDVCVDTETGKGFLACGMHNGGEFTVSEIRREAA